MKNIHLLIGAPGSGKTSAARRIEKAGVSHYSLGGMYREIKGQGGALSKRVGRYIDNGKMVPLNTARDVISAFLRNGEETIIIDGFPRSMEQVVMFASLTGDEYRLKNVIEILVDRETAFERIMARQRGRDSNQVMFNRRMEGFEKEIPGIRDYYTRQDCYTAVDGNRDPEAVAAELRPLVVKQEGEG